MFKDLPEGETQYDQKPAVAPSDLTDVLAAETTLGKICNAMEKDFTRNGTTWPRAWMQKHTMDRKTLIEARRILIEKAEATNTI